MSEPTTAVGALSQSAAASPAMRYFNANADVKAAYEQNPWGMTPAQFALAHYNNFGKSEQRSWGDAPAAVSGATNTTAAITPGQQYFLDNPDVAAAYKTNNYGLTPDEFAKTHYDKFGMEGSLGEGAGTGTGDEGRTWAQPVGAPGVVIPNGTNIKTEVTGAAPTMPITNTNGDQTVRDQSLSGTNSPGVIGNQNATGNTGNGSQFGNNNISGSYNTDNHAVYNGWGTGYNAPASTQFATPVLNALYSQQQQNMAAPAPTFNFQSGVNAAAQPLKRGGRVAGALTKVIRGC